jgi:hypothetical protein
MSETPQQNERPVVPQSEPMKKDAPPGDLQKR